MVQISLAAAILEVFMPCISTQAVAAALVLGAAAIGRAEVVVNGGFETGEFFPWLAPPSVPNESVFRVSGGGGHTGEYYAKLSSRTTQYMTQTLPTVAGTDYELSFWLRRTSNAPAPFRVRWEGSTVFGQNIVLPDSTHWFEFTVPLHSNITGSFLEFGQNDFPGEFHIDDISVVQVPAPGAGMVMGIAGVVALRRRRRRQESVPRNQLRGRSERSCE